MWMHFAPLVYPCFPQCHVPRSLLLARCYSWHQPWGAHTRHLDHLTSLDIVWPWFDPTNWSNLNMFETCLEEWRHPLHNPWEVQGQCSTVHSFSSSLDDAQLGLPGNPFRALIGQCVAFECGTRLFSLVQSKNLLLIDLLILHSPRF